MAQVLGDFHLLSVNFPGPKSLDDFIFIAKRLHKSMCGWVIIVTPKMKIFLAGEKEIGTSADMDISISGFHHHSPNAIPT